MEAVKTRLNEMLLVKSHLPKERECLWRELQKALKESKKCLEKLNNDREDQVEDGDQSLELTRSNGNQIKCLKLAAAYFRAYCFFTGARCGMDDLLREESYKAALNVFQLVCTEICEIADSKCVNLVRYSLHVQTAIDRSICTSFKRRILNVMDSLNFPFTAEDDHNFIKRSIIKQTDKLVALQTLLDDTSVYSRIAKFALDEIPLKRKGQGNDWRLRLNLPIRLLIHCIELRFRYHFYTDVETNRIDKCQWYMKQLISWYNGSLPFILEFICDGDENRERFKIDFAAGITRIASDKVDSDIRFILKHTGTAKADLFSHLIDEFVTFLAVMKPKLPAAVFGWSYVIDALNEEEGFELFMSVQSNRVFDIIKALDTETDATDPLDSPISTEIGEELATVLLSAFDRISMFVRPSCQIRWYQMFKSCLHKIIAQQERKTSNVRQMLHSGRMERDATMNRCLFILTRVISLYDSVVFALRETSVMVKLQYLSEQFTRYIAKIKLVHEDELTLYDSFDMSKEATFISEEDCISLNRTPLETASSRLEQLCSSVLNVLASAILIDLTSQQKNIVASLHREKEMQPKCVRDTDVQLSLMSSCYNECSNVLRMVRQKIEQISSALPLLMTLEENLYSLLDSFFYKQVILDDEQQWSCSDASRFSQNIRDYWVDFVVQTKSDLTTDIALPRTACACRLLCMNPAGAKFLRETLISTTDSEKLQEVISEFNLSNLTQHDILQVLALRVE